jgi:hypothetical protein
VAYIELAFSKGSKENNKWPTASPGTQDQFLIQQAFDPLNF